MATEPPPEAVSLPSPPTDGITALSYLPGQPTLLASTSFDGAVRIHDTNERKFVLSQTMESGPLLSLATPKGLNALVTGGLDGTVRMFDIAATQYQVIGRHTAEDPKLMGCSSLGALAASGGSNAPLIASAGWNSQFHLWDVRQSSSSAAATIQLPGKAFSMDVDPANQNRVVIATAGRRICVIDVRAGGDASLVLDRESSLKFQSRAVRFFPDGNGIALGSIEGRVAVEFLEELGLQAKMKKYAFKCHRQGDTVYPVNCIAFHPQYGTFATGGCDGYVSTWDGLHKKKLTTLPQFSTSIAALAFNHDGSELAIAPSYTYEDGEREHPRDEIFIRRMLDSECQPKTK
ncbi:Mitotic checkpoint protein BUB3 [Seminavis robusta]|uniref:Mitotic checkpoint protein BUB3 n=1 Tax=Seminavis robusta TaxID=568900 RepID=A0A9N8DMT2_9STRA|nr:Mitotic checkpoint protein BUB3 [Seminavis robusta]|eukprot:Sro142_g066160.1 Mitotic checkpoint protein BUB3 (347) ;mRNA; r:33081-34510